MATDGYLELACLPRGIRTCFRCRRQERVHRLGTDLRRPREPPALGAVGADDVRRDHTDRGDLGAPRPCQRHADQPRVERGDRRGDRKSVV